MTYKKIHKAMAILSLPLTIFFISHSSLKIIGESNSFVDIFLSSIIFLGFIQLLKTMGKFLVWYGWINEN